MKHIGSFSKLAAVSLALAAVFFVNPVQAATNAGTKQGEAKVTKITGNATYKYAKGETGALKVGQILTAGDSISTALAATVELSLGVNGQSITIKPDSTMAIDQLDFTGTGADTVINTRLNLTRGGMHGNVKKLAANSKYEIKTANGIAGVRGTAFSIYSNGVIHVTHGQIKMIYSIGGVETEIMVIAGQTMYPPTTPGGAPTLGPIPPGDTLIVSVDYTLAYPRQTTVTFVSPTVGGTSTTTITIPPPSFD